jgi:CRP-like cAMP-binding protein
MTIDKMNTLTKDFFDEILPLSDKSFSELKNIFKSVSKSKDEVFIRVGKQNYSEYLVVKGFCRSFLINPDGEEITISFFKNRSALSPHLIRSRDEISLLNFQALTDLELVEFDAKSFRSLMIENMEIRNLGNTILLNELISKTEKEIALASFTARERLIKFRSEYAILENLIPHPIIASYLGITNVSLSRLRSEITKG